jgi:hypothetical protein
MTVDGRYPKIEIESFSVPRGRLVKNPSGSIAVFVDMDLRLAARMAAFRQFYTPFQRSTGYYESLKFEMSKRIEPSGNLEPVLELRGVFLVDAQ